MECIAHRGFAGLKPENTLTAVSEAADVADWIEVDVRRCGSGEPVVIHDATVDRVTDSSGRVADLTAAELADLDVLGSGEGIPTLGDVLTAVPADVGVDIELKERGLADESRQLLDAHDGRALVSSFDRQAIAPLRDAAVPIAIIGETDPDELLATASELGCAGLCLHHELCRPSVLERAREDGRDVYAWTIRNEETARESIERGVDGLIVDRPEFCAVGSSTDRPGSA